MAPGAHQLLVLTQKPGIDKMGRGSVGGIPKDNFVVDIPNSQGDPSKVRDAGMSRTARSLVAMKDRTEGGLARLGHFQTSRTLAVSFGKMQVRLTPQCAAADKTEIARDADREEQNERGRG